MKSSGSVSALPGVYFDLDRKAEEVNELKILSGQADFWNDQKKAAETGRRLETLDSEVQAWTKLRDETRQLEEYVALAQHEEDTSVADAVEQQFKDVKKNLKLWNSRSCLLDPMTLTMPFFPFMPAPAVLTRKIGRRC